MQPAFSRKDSLWQKLARWLDVLFLLALALITILLDFSRLPFSTLKLLRLSLLLYLGTIFALTRLPLIFLASLKELLLASHGRQRVWRIRRSVFLKTPFFVLIVLFIFYTFQPHSLRRSRGQEATPSTTPTAKDPLIQEKLTKKQATLLKSDFRAGEDIEAFVGSHSLGSLKTTVLDPNGQEISPPTTIEGEILKIKPELNFRPGKYIVKITNENNQTVLEQNFTWGVLAINTNKSIFLPGENVYLQMAALSDYGHTLCQANLKLEIISPQSETTTLTTKDGTITSSDTCGSDNVTDSPDYFSYYQVGQTGIYRLKLTNLDNNYEIADSFEVKGNLPFDVERLGATRINPFKANYWMTLKIKANEDFEGEVKETLPAGFEVTQSGGGQVGTPGDVLPIVWPVNLKKGEVRELKYEYDAPDVSPQLYLLGPLTIQPFDNSAIVFQEFRQWQIAADAACNATVAGTWGDTDTATFVGCTGAADTSAPDGGARPGSGDDLTINDGIDDISLKVDATINSLIIGDSVTTGSRTELVVYNNLTITTTVYIWGGNGANDHVYLNINGGSVTVSGLITFDPVATNAGRDARIFMSAGTLNANGGITFDSTTGMIDNQVIELYTGSVVNLKGAFTNLSNGDLTNLGGTFNYADTTAAQTVGFDGAAPTYENLSINNTSAGGATLGAGIGPTTVTGNLTVGNGSNAALFKNGSFGIALASGKTFEVKNGATFEMSTNSNFPAGTGMLYTFGASSTVRYLQTYSYTITDVDYGNLEIKPATGGYTQTFPTGTVWIRGNLTIGDGSAAASANATTNSTTLDVDGNLTIAASAWLIANTSNPFTVGGSWSNSSTGTFIGGAGGTVTFDAGTTSKQIDSGGDYFTNVVFNNANGGWTAVTSTFGATTVTVTAGTFDTGAVSVSITGVTDVTGTLLHSNTVLKTFSGNVTINAGGVWNETAAATFSFGGNLTNNATTWTALGGTHTFTGSGKTISGSTTTVIPVVNIANGASVTNTGTLTVSTTLTTPSGISTFVNGDTSTGTLNFGGAYIGVTTFTATAANNIVNYNRADAQTVANVNYYTLNLSGSGIKTMASGSTTAIGGNFNLSGTAAGTTGANLAVTGSLSVGAGTSLTVGAYTFSVGTTTTVAATGSLIFSSATNPSKTFTGDVTVSGTWNEQAAITPSFGGNLTNNATSWTASSGTHTFTGAAKTLTGATATVIPTVYLASTNQLTIYSTLTVSTSLSADPAAVFSNSTGGVLNYGGSTIGITWFFCSSDSTVNYNSSSIDQTVRANYYGTLIITKSGKVATLAGNTSAGTQLTISAGTLDTDPLNSYQVTISGGFSNSGVFTANASDIVIGGTTAANIAGFSTTGDISFTRTANTATFTGDVVAASLTMNGSGGTLDLGVSRSHTINGTVTLTAGTLDGGSSTLALTGNWTKTTGSFDADASTITFSGADLSTQAISGDTTFNNFTASTLTNGDDRILQFTGGSVTTVSGTWTITGFSGKVITLQSSDTSNWTITPNAAAVTYVGVYRSTRTGTTFCATFSTKDVNCIDWTVSGGGSCGGNTAPNPPTALAQKKTTDVVLAVGDWTNETSVKFTATADDTDNPDTLYLCVEKKPIASAFTGPEDACSSPGVAYSGTPVEVTVTIAGVTDTQYHWRARVKDAADDYSSWVAYGDNPTGDGTTDGSPANRDYGIDTSDPTSGAIYDGGEVGVDTDFSTTSLSELSANWDSFDTTVSGLASYDYSIGTTQGGIGVKGWTNVGVGSSAAATGLTLQTSQVYYFNVRAVDNAGNTQDPVISSDGQVITPSLSFSVAPPTLSFANLNSVNSYTTTADATLTTSTNAYNGYVVRAFVTDYPRSLVGDFTIPDFNGGSYALPDGWLSSDRGFGYTSSDPSVQGSNKFGSTPCPGGGDPPCYAPFNHDPPGDIIADHTANVSGEPITGEPFTITCKVMADNTKQAANYVTTIVYTITAQY